MTSVRSDALVIIVDTAAPVITGLADDTTPCQSKTWTWGSTDATAVMYRFAVDQNPAWTPAGAYAAVITTTKTDAPGLWHLHVQARDAAGNESAVTTVAATLVNGPPAVAIPAAASPNPVAGTTVNLSVLGADASGEAALSYTWATTGTAPAPVAYSNTTAQTQSKSTVATFTAAGSYSITATIMDAEGLTATSSVTVTVSQTSKNGHHHAGKDHRRHQRHPGFFGGGP